MSVCSIAECDKISVGRGWCHKHYKRWQQHGDPEKVLNKRIHGMTVAERILTAIDIDKSTGCWNWTGSISKATGRGRLKVNRKTTVAYRASYSQFVDVIPDGISVCHKCDNPLCVNPEHLFLGTCKDNMQDCVTKGRNAKHERHNKAKLNWVKVNDIRTKDLTAKEYASKYNVHWSTIYCIWSNKIWVNSNQKKGNI